MQWHLQSEKIPKNLDELRDVLLHNRNLNTAAEQKTFLQPASPHDLTLAECGIDQHQTELAIERIKRAQVQGEKVVVFGDYDADGICATTVMWETLHALGCQVMPFIPEREKHGYGMNERSLADLLAHGAPDLVITVDNGIVAHQAVTQLKAAGADVIITDHHQPEATLPAADAIVHTTQLCGTTVAWMFARELRAAYDQPFEPNQLLELCVMATLADQVPLLKANRQFAWHGLPALQRTTRPGLLALMEKAAIVPATLTTNSIHFGLVPRLNAMGRLAHSIDALRLLCTHSAERAAQLTELLHETNARRQDLTSTMVDHARAQAASWQDEHIIVVASTEYHDGVIGLIAGRLTEEFHKPAIAIAIGEKVAKASARSVPGVNITELLRQLRSELLELGGHPLAAGFSLKASAEATFTQKLQALAKAEITAEQLNPQLELECMLPFGLLDESLLVLHQQFEPFGQGNPSPVYGVSQLKALDAFSMGRDHRHLKLVAVPAADDAPVYRQLNCVGWGMADELPALRQASQFDLAGHLELNVWKDRKNLQVVVEDVRLF